MAPRHFGPQNKERLGIPTTVPWYTYAYTAAVAGIQHTGRNTNTITESSGFGSFTKLFQKINSANLSAVENKCDLRCSRMIFRARIVAQWRISKM